MADVAILAQQVQATPNGYTIPGGQEIILKSIRVAYNGAGAGGSFVPVLQLVAPGPLGTIVSEYPLGSTLAAGASADVTWFPGLKGASSSGSGGGIQFDTEPQSGGWLYAETTGVGPVADGQTYGFALRATPGNTNGGFLLGTAYAGTDHGVATDVFVTSADGDHTAFHVNSHATGTGRAIGEYVEVAADNGGQATGLEADAIGTTTHDVAALIGSAENDGSGKGYGLKATADTTGAGDSIAGSFLAAASGGGIAYAIKVDGGLCFLKLPTSAGVAGTLWNNGGVVTVS